MKKLVTLFLIHLIFIATATAVADDIKTVRMGYNPQTGNILGFIAIEKGLDKKLGLNIKLVPFSNSTDALTALHANKVDMGVSFGTTAPLTFITKGSDFTLFGGYVSGGMPVYAKQDFQYKDIHSFVGKKVAVARMYTPEIVWRGAMARAGLDANKDTTVLEFKRPTEVLEAVKSGKADVGIGTNSTYLQALAAGLKILTWTNELDPMHVCCRPVARTAWLQDDPTTVKNFLKVWIQAEDFLMEHPQESVKINAQYLGIEEDAARIMLLETNQEFESDPKTNGIRYMWQLLGDLQYANTEGIDIEKHLNASLYQEALDELIEENPDNKNFQHFKTRFAKYNL